jgi:archaellum component FlaC
MNKLASKTPEELEAMIEELDKQIAKEVQLFLARISKAKKVRRDNKQSSVDMFAVPDYRGREW